MKERWIVGGKVQGVGFRYFVFTLAKQYSLKYGYVANLPDGSVEIVLDAQEPKKEVFLQSIRTGKRDSLIRVESLVKVSSHTTTFEVPEDRFVIF